MGCDGTARASACDTAAADGVDVITVCRFLALQAMERLTAPGAVSVNPLPGAPTLSFLVSADAVSWWPSHSGVRGSCTEVVLPPDGKEAPPGPYWLIGRSQGLTSVAALRAALEAVARRWPEREAGPAALVRELWVPHGARSAASGQNRIPRGRGW
ncbi:hypothetical protein [Streptomyces sp. LUP47B]|uniref:hypothetical protein n=1 Tax=Streptomyces sp. LUP47B TaxID=1890286 RepID=UPI000851AC5F|nr:hypothetical protein [Streptomyces sp. LUP47B]